MSCHAAAAAADTCSQVKATPCHAAIAIVFRFLRERNFKSTIMSTVVQRHTADNQNMLLLSALELR